MSLRLAGGCTGFERASATTRLAWYDIEGQTGKPVAKGVVPLAKNRGAGQADPTKTVGGGVVSKDQKNVYCVADGSTVLWYKLAADGAAVKAGERACQGNDAWTLVIAPNGKHLYNMSRQSIACLEIGPRENPSSRA